MPERTEVPDRLPGGAPGARVEARRRLVEEDELRVADQREPEVEAALLPARQRAAARVGLVGEADDLDHLVDVAALVEVAAEHARLSRTVRFG